MSGFRRAAPRDLGAILALQREYYSGAKYPFDEPVARAALRTLLRRRSVGAVWLAEDGDGPFAYVVLTAGYSLEYHGPDAFVDELFVRESHRGGGIGAQALAAVEAECRRRGIRALHLEVEEDNPAALALYRRHGFEEHRRRLMTRLIEQPPPRRALQDGESSPRKEPVE